MKNYLIKKLGGYTNEHLSNLVDEAVNKIEHEFKNRLRNVRVEIAATYAGNVNQVLLTQSGFIDKVCEVLGWDKIYNI